NAAKTAVSSGIGTIVSTVRGLPGRIKSGLGNIAGTLKSAGRDLIRGFIDGIKEMATRAVDAAKGVAKSAKEGAKRMLGISSPSKVVMEIGQQTGQGLAISVEGRSDRR